MKQALLRACLALHEEGLNHSHAGNISVRTRAGMLITASGITARELDEKAIVQMHLDGTFAPTQLKPSSEWRFHAAVYQARNDLNAVVHAHPPYSTALACARMSIPAGSMTGPLLAQPATSVIANSIAAKIVIVVADLIFAIAVVFNIRRAGTTKSGHFSDLR